FHRQRHPDACNQQHQQWYGRQHRWAVHETELLSASPVIVLPEPARASAKLRTGDKRRSTESAGEFSPPSKVLTGPARLGARSSDAWLFAPFGRRDADVS